MVDGYAGIAIGSIGAIIVYHIMRLIAKWRGTDFDEPASPTSGDYEYNKDEFANKSSQ